jgi:hypothetical protein
VRTTTRVNLADGNVAVDDVIRVRDMRGTSTGMDSICVIFIVGAPDVDAQKLKCSDHLVNMTVATLAVGGGVFFPFALLMIALNCSRRFWMTSQRSLACFALRPSSAAGPETRPIKVGLVSCKRILR